MSKMMEVLQTLHEQNREMTAEEISKCTGLKRTQVYSAIVRWERIGFIKTTKRFRGVNYSLVKNDYTNPRTQKMVETYKNAKINGTAT